MKRYNPLISLLLAFVMVFSLAACGKETPTETTATTTATTEPPATEPAEPGAADIYNEARKALDAAANISLSIDTAVYTTVAGSQFSESSAQTLTYQAIGTETAAILSEEEISFGTHLEKKDEDAEPVKYKEIWVGGNVYAELDETYFTTTAMDAETAKTRYIPVVILDASLYSTSTAQSAEGGTRIQFSDATAAETWAIPEGAELIEASGSALISGEGALAEMTYNISYTYGTADIRMEVTSKPLAEAKTVAAPENTASYTAVEVTDALYLYGTAKERFTQADTFSTDGGGSIWSEAIGVYLGVGQTNTVSTNHNENVLKSETTIHVTDYTTGETYDQDLESIYQNGKLTTTVDNGLPSSASVTWEDTIVDIWDEMDDDFSYLSPDYWQEVKSTLFGNLLLLEFTLNDNFGNTQQNDICTALLGSASALMEMASEYKNTKLNGYLSIDLYTGLPVAMGYEYEGVHTIEGTQYATSKQEDNSYLAPDKGTYHEITEKFPQEAKPENTPTPLFYKVTGADGQQMWLFGTMHVGDSSFGYLPTEIHDAFTASDALVVETDVWAFRDQFKADEKLQEQISNCYYYDGKDNLETYLSEEEYAYLVQLLKATGNYNINTPYMKAAVVADLLSNSFMQLGYQLDDNYGVEEWLYIWAQEQNKPVWEMETNLFKVQLSTGWSHDLQMLLLEDAMAITPEETWVEANELYELWCSGDEAAVIEFLNTDVDISTLTEEELAEYEAAKPLLEEYDNGMEHNRNADMLKKAIEYLESGDVIFYAVGLAHLLNDTTGLVDGLREAGYTVELVTYAN